MHAVPAATAIQTNAPAVLAAFDLYDEFATDAALETGGAWVTRGTARFLIARDGNENFADAIAKAFSENEEGIKGDTPEAKELSASLMRGVLAKTILLGWENVSYKKQPLVYSVENAAEMLKHSEFRTWVRQESLKRDHYKAKAEEAAEKN